MNKKLFLGIVALIIAVLIIVILILIPKFSNQNTEDILLKDGMIIPSEKCSQLEKVITIHGAGCGACAIAIPRLQELEQELEMEFGYYDLAIDADKERILSLGLIPEAIPTIIINCKVYVGVRSKEQYKEAILAE
ncbi:MAG: hypothetical protein IB618_04170 [Candidatus Pacearchaeota archaeon]|nr:MAG: hypothetical protein IB618_04170 [Candidatus Pacearchaeota archaeon]